MNRKPITMKGFTLIELIIVVGIVGILAAIAFPSYTQYIQEARRADATGALLECAAIFERNYTVNNTYIAATNSLCDNLSADGFYTIDDTSAVTATTYTISAIPRGPQQGDTTCASLTLNQIGVQAALDVDSNDTSAECWNN